MGIFTKEYLHGLGIAVLALFIAWSVREMGILQKADLALYDVAIKLATPAKNDERIVLVVDTEEDIVQLGFPLSDQILADTILKLQQRGAAGVVVDKYRDIPVAPGTETLNALLTNSQSLFWVQKFGTTRQDTVPAPKAMPRAFVGCGDIIEDADGVVRRALIYLDAGEDPCYSLAFVAARQYMGKRGKAMTFSTDSPVSLRIGDVALPAIEANHGPYANSDNAGFQVALRLNVDSSAFKTYRISEVLSGKIPDDAFKDKLVFMGSTADSLRDFFYIAGVGNKDSPSRISGVALHAAITSNLIDASSGSPPPIRLASPSLIYGLALALAFVGGLLASTIRNVARLAAIVFPVFLIVLCGVWLLWSEGIYIAIVAPVLAFVISVVVGTARTAYLEHREKGQMLSLFGKHMSRELAQSIWESREECFANGAILPRAVIATAFFVDIRGFTTTTERLKPEATIAWLNQGLSTMSDAIMLNQGVITRFAGDAMMALFGSPIPRLAASHQASDAENAVRAGLAIGVNLDALNKKLKAADQPLLRVRVGIQTGPMVQGSIGGSDRMEFTVLGDAVNTASRLESYAMDDDGSSVRILIGEPTFEMVGHKFETKLVGDLVLKGKLNTVKVYQVTAAIQQGTK